MVLPLVLHLIMGNPGITLGLLLVAAKPGMEDEWKSWD